LKIEQAGASLISVHGRTREHLKMRTGRCNLQIIKRIKEAVSIPVIANGGIANFDDIETVLRATGADGVMTSESILE
jgi:tRNA-dihydrouridine synthase